MSNVYDPNGNVGLGVPWTVIQASTYSTTLSSISSRTPIPGAPSADQDSDALALALNEWENPPSGGASYKLRVQTGGNVGPAGATWAWKDSGEPDTSYRGHDWPTRARRMWTAGARAGETAGGSDMVTLPSGRVVMVYAAREGAGYDEIRALWMEAESVDGGTAATEIMIVTEDTGHANYEGWDLVSSVGYPTVAYWEEEGRVLCAVRYTTATATLGQVAIFQSLDEGASWSLRKRTALRAPFSTASRAGYGNLILRRCGGSWVLLDEWRDTTAPAIRYISQYAGTSPDDFELVETLVLSGSGAADGVIDIQAASDGDGVLVVGVGYDTAAPVAVDVHSWRLGSAWMPLSEAERVSLTDNMGGPIAGHSPAVALDPDGTAWAVFLDAGSQYIYLVYSLDRGETWLPAGYHPLETAAGANPLYLSLVCYRGGLLVMFAANNGADWIAAANLRHCLVALGGWDNQPLSYIPTGAGSQGRLGFGRRYGTFSWGVADSDCLSWFPPVNLTTTTPAGALTGAAPITTVPDGSDPYVDFADAGAGSYVTWTPSAATYNGGTSGIVVEVDGALQIAAASATADNRIMQVRLPDAAGGGANIVEVSVRVAAASVVLYDEIAGAAIATIAIAGTTRREYRLVISDSNGATVRVALGYRLPGGQVWTQVTGTTTTGASAAGARVRCGAVLSAAQTVRLYRVCFVGTIGPQGPRDLTRALAVANILGRPAAPGGVPINLGLQIGWRRGPLHPGHTWTLSPSAEYPPELVGPRDYPSPSDRWQSSTDGVLQEWVWEPLSGQLWRPPGALFFLAVLFADGIDQLVLAGRDSAGAYQTLITANLSAGSAAMRYSAPTTGAASGGALRPDTTGTASSRPWRENELAGGWIRVTTSGAAYRIIGNTPGLWGPSAAFKPTIYVSGWNTAEPATGGFTVYPPGSLHVSAEQNPATGYDRIRLRVVSSANTVGGRYTLKVAVGSVFLPGRRYSYGRNPSVEPVGRGVETAGGRSFYDPNQPVRRYARFAWADPYGTRDYHGYTTATGPDALLLASGGAHAHSFVSSTHKELEGIMRLLGGPGRCLVYLPRVEAQLTAWSTTDPDRWMYGRITSALTMPRPWGDEHVREEVTVSELTMQEEV